MHRLYAILDVETCDRAGRAPLDVARAFLSGGARLLQLRAKTWGSGAMLDLAQAIQAEAARVGATLIVNDRADVALLSGAGGVHVGQDDLTPIDVRRVVGERAIVGWSTHTPDQVAWALAQPISYVAIGPVFGTGTKDTGYQPIGLNAVRATADVAAPLGLAVVAIGGITLERAPAVIAAGATSVAVISDLLVGDPEARVRAFVAALH